MARLEDLTKGARVRGILPGGAVTVIEAKPHSDNVVEVFYRDDSGKLDSSLIYRDQEPHLQVEPGSRPWSFDGDGALFKLATEAERIRLAWLVDPLLAVNISNVEPLPHQITAVYEEMLLRQPLRFLLADDPGSGKTIMAGLLIKELIARGDLRRCLVVCPGSLAEQWQDELWTKFQLEFSIVSRQAIEESRTGNPFQEKSLVICRLDQLSRNEDFQARLDAVDWDLIVCDEAHKMSASCLGNEITYTKRYQLGRRLSRLCRHFLLLTATPHNGKEEDFQLFLALLDGDRFEGRFRDGVHTADPSDIMRRLTKEKLLKFDGSQLFPERRAYTVDYPLSDAEAELYTKVTNYVRDEFDRAARLENEGRRGTVGFALTILQRRLASSPEAIYQSLRRRKERLESRHREESLLRRGQATQILPAETPTVDIDELEDLDDAPGAEGEMVEEEIVDRATASQTIAELEIEIRLLKELEGLAEKVRRSNADTKWKEMSRLLQDEAQMFDAHGHRRKLVIFTEHRDTLSYLTEKMRTVLGRPEAVVAIHGGLLREERRKAQEAFTQDKDVFVLVATDAAGEGINLQRAHLMVNYDLPWNPNRLEQRFGRIHRIGQTEVCHLWNLVAKETREGDVFIRLLEKLNQERESLKGAVFDVLGQVFQGRELRDLLIEAVRYGDQPEVRARLFERVDNALDREKLRDLIEGRALARDSMDLAQVERIRADMERAETRKLQPHFISSFFQEAFRREGGTVQEREAKRYEVTHVPGVLRSRDRQIGIGAPVLSKYERITFEKGLIAVPGKPMASLVCPGHPLLDSTIDLTLEHHRHELKRGAVLVDPSDLGTIPRLLFLLEHEVRDGRLTKSGDRRVISRRMQFVEVGETGDVRSAGYAPHLDYEPLPADAATVASKVLEGGWLQKSVEERVMSWAIAQLVPEHLHDVKTRKEELVDKTSAAVKERLTKEINYWDLRAQDLKAQELAGKQPKMNWQKARERADELEGRLQRRLKELEEERQISATAPIVMGGALVLPRGLVDKILGRKPSKPHHAQETERVEMLAMEAVIGAERTLGNEPRDVSEAKRGYDIESKESATGRLRFIEVKGRVSGADTVTVTKNEILTALNKPDGFVLALVTVGEDSTTQVRYLRKPFQREPDFDVTSVNYNLNDLLGRAEDPR